METLNSSSRSSALRALALILVAAVVAWLLYVAGIYAENVTMFDPSGTDPVKYAEEYPRESRVVWTQYFFVIAIAVFGLCALLAKRRLAPIRAENKPRSRLIDPISQFAGVALIIAAVLAAWAVFVVFLDGFFSGDTDPAPVDRIMSLYLPIVLYTVLVVTIVLAGFVFMPAVPRSQPVSMSLHAGPSPANTQRTTALAYATPIIAAAIALMLGLIVYDLTHTTLQAWIWVVILTIIGAGVLAGTVFAQRSSGNVKHPVSVVAGAKNLNFVLSIIFAVVVTGMSLSYGASAVAGLNVMPNLSISVYSDSETPLNSDRQEIEYVDPYLSVYGSDLKRGSEGTLSLEPTGRAGAEGVEITSERVDRDKWLSIESKMPSSLPAADYEVVTRAVAVDNREIEMRLPLTVTASGNVLLPEGGEAGTEDEGRLLPVTANWLLGDLLPAGAMLVLVAALVTATLTVRNRDEFDARMEQ